MKLRLFWKILIAFWVTFFAVVPALWAIIFLSGGLDRQIEIESRRASEPVLSILAHSLEHGGRAEFDRMLSALPGKERERVRLSAGGEPGLAKGSNTALVERAATGADGRHYTLVYLHSPPDVSNGMLKPPWQMLLAGALGGLAFSLLLAWYLSKPIRLLRDGLDRVAHGDFDVRLREAVGRRKDEIADLAGQFDAMAQRLHKLVTARDRLFHDVSHELRSPLSRLQVAIGLARQNPVRLEMSLERIEREARRLDSMVQELLVLARAESRTEQVEDYFDPVAVAEAVVEDALFEAQANRIEVRLHVPPVPEENRPTVKGNAELFRRAVENVVRNALRFSPAGGTIKVEVALTEDPPAYCLTIADDGPGVEDDKLDTLFEPFVRGDVAGFGLGLAIAKRAVEAHGGTISGANAQDGGFVVRIELPATTQTTVG